MPFTKCDKNINRTGLNKGSVSLVKMLREKLTEIPVTEDNIDRLTYAQLFINKYAEKALTDGDKEMMKDFIDRIDGRPKQQIEVNDKRLKLDV